MFEIRHEDWLACLNKVILENIEREHVWGEWDCALWAADAVLAMTGQDFAEEFRGKYNSAASAALALREMGSGTLYNVMRKKFGNPIHAAMAWRGDIVYYRKCLGICYGQLSLFVGAEAMVEGEEPVLQGLIKLPTLEMQHVFKVR